jgi:hypothetical protein
MLAARCQAFERYRARSLVEIPGHQGTSTGGLRIEHIPEQSSPSGAHLMLVSSASSDWPYSRSLDPQAQVRHDMSFALEASS